MSADLYNEPFAALSDFLTSNAPLLALLGVDDQAQPMAMPKDQQVGGGYPRLLWSTITNSGGATDVEPEQSIDASVQIEFE